MYVVELKKITKVYPGGIVANHEVDFDLKKGEIHALLGENGAGKTTLMKILSGCLKPTSGSIYVEGKEVKFNSPSDALKQGIGMVHQHLALIPTMTVLENLMLGLIGQKFNMKRMLTDVEKLSKLLGFKVKLDSPIYALSVGERQRIEILRLLLSKAKVLIFDEPTSMLCGPEIDRFLQLLKSLSSSGYSIVLITHKIREAMRISDRITVMRTGRVVATLGTDEIRDESHLVELMVGERLTPITKKITPPLKKEPLLIVRNLVVNDDMGLTKVKGISFELHEGEILGIAGVEGNGQKELVEAIVGLRRPASGEIVFNEKNSNPGRMNYIPAERLELGVAPTLSVAINSVLRCFDEKEFKKHGNVLNFAIINEFAKKVVSFMNVKTPSLKTPVKYLSGGNIQKIIVGREIITPSKILIAEQPTAGLDAKSAFYVRRTLSELASKDVGILLISSDLDEILELSDRIAIINDGKFTKILEREEADPMLIGAYMLAAEGTDHNGRATVSAN
ncbi:MAG: ABC transporter ATP-binding protein [Nitrososphaerota archaeon]|nr:ABC transporter ATP-binding protein [Aigarchaeota archaeon]MDW8077197.1 ABC transporter ATP-binding protein [Nitrososphaerota archaeon]